MPPFVIFAFYCEYLFCVKANITANVRLRIAYEHCMPCLSSPRAFILYSFILRIKPFFDNYFHKCFYIFYKMITEVVCINVLLFIFI